MFFFKKKYPQQATIKDPMKTNMHLRIYDLVSKIYHSTFGRFIADILVNLRFHCLVYWLLGYYKKIDFERDHPTNEMQLSVKFFKDNEERINKISGYLADKKSKDIYRKVIKFRQTHNRKDRPYFTPTFYDQYFAKNIVKLNDKEVFVDCGAFSGDTTELFLANCHGNFKNIICFEPDLPSINQIEAKFKDKRIVLVPAGVYNETGTLNFKSEMGGSAGIVLNSDSTDCIQIPVTSIDQTSACAEATFIKMDIEGAEMNALIGAQQTILKNHPKLAICIYHSDEDMIRIPEHIHELVPEYKLYVRHHCYDVYETVLYAIP